MKVSPTAALAFRLVTKPKSTVARAGLVMPVGITMGLGGSVVFTVPAAVRFQPITW